MKTIGEALKGRRERLGMTLTELEQRTQLKRQTLIHIENNDFNLLPNKNYTEGFIRKYAAVVNIEPEQLINAHQQEIPSNHHQIETLQRSFRNEPNINYKSKSSEPTKLLLSIGLVVLVTLLIWIILILIF